MKLNFDTDEGLGTRANIGVIVLETDETLEHEFAQIMRLNGVALYHSRIPMVPEIRPDTLALMEQQLPASARLLPPSLTFDAIGYGCTSAASVIGSESVAKAIRSVCSGAQVTDPLAATIAACKHLNVQRLGFVTPYIAEVSATMRARLEAAGLSIAGFGTFNEGNDRVVARITRQSIFEAVTQVAALQPCDAVFIACTNLRCLDLIKEAEHHVGVPVLSSNQVLAWHLLQLCGVTDSQPEFGALFA